MKVVIVGPGAMGCLLAAHFAKAKEDVWLLDNDKKRASVIAAQGISVEGVSGEWRVKVNITTDASEISEPELAVVCVKSYDTKDAVESMKPMLNRNITVLTLQNGIGNVEIISEVAGQEQVIAGTTNQGATLLGPGRVRHAGKGETAIGRLDGKITVQMRYIRELFNQANLETKISRDIKGLLWSKLVINAGINALSAITRLPNGKLIECEAAHEILKEAVNEAVKVAKRKRMKLVYDDPLAKAESVCEATGKNISSMLQDILAKRRTEIDFINGVIVRQAQSQGLSVPVNAALLHLIKTIEASYSQQVEA